MTRDEVLATPDGTVMSCRGQLWTLSKPTFHEELVEGRSDTRFCLVRPEVYEDGQMNCLFVYNSQFEVAA